MSTLKIFHKKKILLVFLLCAAMLVGLVGRLGYLMLFQSEYYTKRLRTFTSGNGISRRPEGGFWMSTARCWRTISRSVRFLWSTIS